MISDEELNTNSCYQTMKKTKHLIAIIATLVVYIPVFTVQIVLLLLYRTTLTDLENILYLLSLASIPLDLVTLLIFLEKSIYSINHDLQYRGNCITLIIRLALFAVLLELLLFSYHVLLLIPIMHNLIFFCYVMMYVFVYNRDRPQSINAPFI